MRREDHLIEVHVGAVERDPLEREPHEDAGVTGRRERLMHAVQHRGELIVLECRAGDRLDEPDADRVHRASAHGFDERLSTAEVMERRRMGHPGLLRALLEADARGAGDDELLLRRVEDRLARRRSVSPTPRFFRCRHARTMPAPRPADKFVSSY